MADWEPRPYQGPRDGHEEDECVEDDQFQFNVLYLGRTRRTAVRGHEMA
jgi:hypothetical protein